MRAGLGAFLVRRLFTGLVFVLVVSSSALVLARLAPGDALAELRLQHVDEATIARTRARLHLDETIPVQLERWFSGLLRLDLGQSSRFDRPVGELLRQRAPRTALLAFVSLGLALAVALPLGLITGSQPRSLLARAIALLSVGLVSCPPLVGALGLLWLALVTGWVSVEPGRLVLPVVALALPLTAMIERLQSQATADALTVPDLVAAAARGIPRARLLWIHVSRQSLRPVLGVMGIVIGTLFSGSLAVEWATSWPGLGRLLYDAIVARDTFLVAGCALAGGVLIAVGNLVADLARAFADPRVTEQP